MKLDIKEIIKSERMEVLRYLSSQLKESCISLDKLDLLSKCEAIEDQINNLEVLLSRFKEKYMEIK